MVGLGKGTHSLVTGIVGGALSSTARIVSTTTGTIAHGASYVAGDNVNYTTRQHDRIQRHTASNVVGAGGKRRGGSIIGGVADGGMQIVGMYVCTHVYKYVCVPMVHLYIYMYTYVRLDSIYMYVYVNILFISVRKVVSPTEFQVWLPSRWKV